jgi:hypothetical protein
MKAKHLGAACLVVVTAVAHSEPTRNFPAILNEAQVLPSPFLEHSIEFEVVMDLLTPQGGQKTFRISGFDQIVLWPGEYYRVTDYGGGRARLDYLNPGERGGPVTRQMKKKAKR